jgi:hypothetical protein
MGLLGHLLHGSVLCRDKEAVVGGEKKPRRIVGIDRDPMYVCRLRQLIDGRSCAVVGKAQAGNDAGSCDY